MIVSRRHYIIIIVLMLFLFSSCDKKDKQDNYGIDTIDNTIYGAQLYYALGFSFEKGELVSTIDTPPPDITVHLNVDISGNVTGVYLNTPNLIDSFALAAELPDADDAKSYFDQLLAVGSPQWAPSASQLKENQVWLFRTAEDNYVKFRIIRIDIDDNPSPPFVQMKFEWRLQPGGSTTFDE